ncbi:MAG: AI-2E family transporter [Spirulina sp. SIO3F2]|nr:AI-2E family transporter [Spirulina sp. SIO3F2]
MKLGKWVGLVVVLGSLYVLWQLRSLAIVVLAAILLANALSGVVRRFRKSGLSRPLAVLITLSLALLSLVAIIRVVVPPVLEQIEQLPTEVLQGIDRLSFWWMQLQERIDWPDSIAVPTVDDFAVQLPELANNLLGEGWSWFSNTVSGLLNSLLMIVLTLMLLANPDPYRQGVLRLFPAFYRSRADQILVHCDHVLQRWLKGVALDMVVTAVLSFVVLLSLQIPLALSQALLAGLLTLIPTLGAALSIIPPMAIALLDQPWKSVLVPVFYIAIYQFEHNILTPRLMHKASLPLPAVTLLGQLFFTLTFGLPGLLLSLPLTLVGQVWLAQVVLHDILNPWQSKS